MRALSLHPDRLFPADPATREIARRLYPSAKNLGFEKVALRLPLYEEASEVPRDTVLSLCDRIGNRALALTGSPR
jgi:glucuronate isomerase